MAGTILEATVVFGREPIPLAVRLIVGIAGALVALATIGSAIRTVVVPRGERTFITSLIIVPLRRLFDLAAARSTDWERRDGVLARFGPTALMLYPFVWAVSVIIGLSGVFWALGVEPYRDALVLSGSSLTTLGFRTTDDLPTLLVAIVEGIIGLGLIALLISFLPTIYGTFSRREQSVAKLHLRATDDAGVASAASLLMRRHRIGALDAMSGTWAEWEDWFVEVEETHTSFPVLVFFRSPSADRSWITHGGIALDSAALHATALDVDSEFRAQLMIRTGSLALRRVCDYFGFDYPPAPAPTDPISIRRAEFDQVLARFDEAGLPVVADRDRAWRDFAGWRVNYDRPLLSLATFVHAPEVSWSSDRPADIVPPRIIRRR